MSNLTVAFKDEVQRLAYRAVRQEVEPLRKLVRAQGREIEMLRCALKSDRHGGKTSRRGLSYDSDTRAAETNLRFTARGFKANRTRLDLSADETATLIGVSTATIYNWEQGKVAPRKSQLVSIAALRKVGKKQVRLRLEKLAAANETGRRNV